MTVEHIFQFCNAAVIPFWLLLVLAPRARLTAALVHGPVVPVLLGLVYAAGMVTMGPAPEGASLMSVAGISRFFAAPQGVLVGWVHYLIFDLFVGAWETRDGLRLGIHRLLLLPCQVLTFLLGPVGLLLYLAVRYAARRRLTLDEAR